MSDQDPNPTSGALNDSELDSVTAGSGNITPVKPTFGDPIKSGPGGISNPSGSTTIDGGPSRPPGSIIFPG